jgi:cytochrome c oxidase assembly factor CtaG
VPPSPWSVEPAWDEAAFLLALAIGYALAIRGTGPPRVRVAAFAAGIVLALAAVISPIATVSLHYLLAGHLLQNVMLAEWVPALLVLGVPAALAARIARLPGWRTLTRPLVSLPLWIVTYGVWHVPLLYDAALRHPPLLRLEHVNYLAAGVLLWWPVFQELPHRMPNGARAANLFAAFLFASPLGLLLALLPDAIYSFYEDAPRLWGLDPLADQEIAGVIMAGSEAIVFFGVFSVYVLRWLADEDRVTPERAAGPPSR